MPKQKRIHFSDEEIIISIEQDIDTYFAGLLAVSEPKQAERIKRERKCALQIKDSFLLFLYKS